jgi:hypothetical protein
LSAHGDPPSKICSNPGGHTPALCRNTRFVPRRGPQPYAGLRHGACAPDFVLGFAVLVEFARSPPSHETRSANGVDRETPTCAGTTGPISLLRDVSGMTHMPYRLLPIKNLAACFHRWKRTAPPCLNSAGRSQKNRNATPIH